MSNQLKYVLEAFEQVLVQLPEKQKIKGQTVKQWLEWARSELKENDSEFAPYISEEGTTSQQY